MTDPETVHAALDTARKQDRLALWLALGACFLGLVAVALLAWVALASLAIQSQNETALRAFQESTSAAARNTHTNSGLLRHNDQELAAEDAYLKQILSALEKG